MSKAVHQISVKAVDQTAGAFSSIQARAAAASAKLQSMLGGALVAAGAYLGFRQITAGINELGRLSDVAQKAGASVDDLSRASTAFNVLGIKAGPKEIAKAFQMMAKNTGRTGLQGFYDTIAEIGKLPDVADRSAAAMKVFGRSGLEFMPLIEAAQDGVDALVGVANAMPVIPQAAADAGDAVADAMSIASGGVKSLWLQSLGTVCDWFDKNFEGGIRAAAANSAQYLVYYAKVGVTKAMEYWEKITTFFEAVGSGFGALFSTDGGFMEKFSRAMEVYDEEMRQREIYIESLEESNEKRITDWSEKTLETTKATTKNFAKNYSAAAVTVGGRMVEDAEKAAKTIRSASISNKLVKAGSNELTKLQILGPQYQSEAKKQTTALEKIAANTEKMAAKETVSASAAEELEVWNG